MYSRFVAHGNDEFYLAGSKVLLACTGFVTVLSCSRIVFLSNA